ncbi:KH domain-containing, RNA-binding, signal transduction-associated protein 3 [Heterocephalus glaber]|uniref:KH domain-containing, RNA-binding, signal transduction-associated protein 3 n=1 Tax=Heterocephalus glaber TaxID=10181 RepID=G5BJD2_HETGA|nr:KH domain-containing, RNA-binding, signal transduction-associated protein 3 [Heterocephalus glaber]
MDKKYLPELMVEKDSLDPSFTHALRLVSREIEKFQKGDGKDEGKYIEVVINKNMKLGQKVLIPVKQFPKFNFVGTLLGPKEAYGEYDYDDRYGTAYDEQSYDSYGNSYSTPAQSGTDYYDYGHGLREET